MTAALCDQFKTHFPIFGGLTGGGPIHKIGKGLSPPHHSNWDISLCWTTETPPPGIIYDISKQISLPLKERITLPYPENPSIFLIDKVIRVSVPNADFINEAIGFWEGRRNVAILSVAGGSIISLALLAAAVTPLLSGIFIIAYSLLSASAAFFALLNYKSAREAREELRDWRESQKKDIPSFPKRIAEIRASIFEAYNNGKQIPANGRAGLIDRYILKDEVIPLLVASIYHAHLDPGIEELKDLHDKAKGYKSDYAHASPCILNYTFPTYENLFQ